MHDPHATVAPPADETLECPDRQAGALLWILSRCLEKRHDAELLLAALHHCDLLSGNPKASPRVRLVCARLAARWRETTAGTARGEGAPDPIVRTLH